MLIISLLTTDHYKHIKTRILSIDMLVLYDIVSHTELNMKNKRL